MVAIALVGVYLDTKIDHCNGRLNSSAPTKLLLVNMYIVNG